MKKELPNKKREWVRLILSALVLFAMVPITILAIPKVMALTQATHQRTAAAPAGVAGNRRLGRISGHSGDTGGRGDDSW